jgi:HlyD family secretion protein
MNLRYRIMKLHLTLPFIAALALSSGCKPPGSGVLVYGTAPVTQGSIVQHVTASGSLSAVVSVDVGSQVSGKIVALNVDFNSPVKKGQLVAEIDPTVYAATLRQMEGDLASAKADVTLKRQNLERKKILVPMKAASQLDLDQATAELAQSEAAVTIRQAALESAQANLGYCKITAPVDGMVISRKVDVGQTVIAAMSTPVLFTIAQDITKMTISASVSEADIGQVRNGQAVTFSVDAFPDEVFKGSVTQVRRSPTTTQNVVTYETIITVDNPEQKLFPGMTADVSILVSERTNVLIVPNTALRFTPPDRAKFETNSTPSAGPGQVPGSTSNSVAASGPRSLLPSKLARNQRLVYSLGPDASTLKPIIVTIGLTDGVNTEVQSGVAEGQSLVTATVSGTQSSGFGGPPPPGS